MRFLKAGEFLTKLTPVWAGGFGAAVIILFRNTRFGNYVAQRTWVLTVKCLAGAFDHSVLLSVTDQHAAPSDNLQHSKVPAA